MKKFISLLIASAMVVSLVPATAFAGQSVSATAKVVGADTIAENGTYDQEAELQITIADATYSGSDKLSSSSANTSAKHDAVTTEIEVTLDDAYFSPTFLAAVDANPSSNAYVCMELDDEVASDYDYDATILDVDFDGSTTDTDIDEITITVAGNLVEGDKIIVVLHATHDLDSGDYATVSVDSDMVEADDLVFLSCEDKGIEASIKDLTYIADDEVATLDYDLVIEEEVAGTLLRNYVIRLELSKGFEFNGGPTGSQITGAADTYYDDEYAYILINNNAVVEAAGEIEIPDLEIYADGVDAGDIATIEVVLYSAYNNSDFTDLSSKDKVATCEVEVAEVCDYDVTISVDEDEDVPVFYNGVDVDNTGLTDGGDHWSLEVTIAESFPGAWSYRDAWTLTLPEGVYVTDMDFDEYDMTWVSGGKSKDATEAAFITAYQDGDYEAFEFSKRIFDERTTSDDCIELVFSMELVAAPDFEGEVVLGFEGDSVTEDEVVIAEFVSAYTVEAQQNDVIIDYRNTPIETPIVITEAEAELWSDDMIFYLDMEGSYIDFDDEGEATVNSDSEMEIDYDVTDDDDESKLTIEIEAESEDEAAVITIEGIELYMNRSLAAGAYALDVDTYAAVKFMAQAIFAPGASSATASETNETDDDEVWYVGDVIDGTDYEVNDGYSVEVCENFVNIVTAGSDQATTFTTKVIVPIGEYYIYSGGTQIELDVPAYISADGYTMLPVRAVATAIGVSTSNVLWDATTQQVTIIYGTKTIAMVIGQQYMTVNGTAIPTTACPEIVDGRTFLPLRDLATALSVITIDWDADTRTASLN